MLGWEKRINGNKSLELEDSGRDIWVGLRKRAMGWGGVMEVLESGFVEND